MTRFLMMEILGKMPKIAIERARMVPISSQRAIGYGEYNSWNGLESAK
jgi:hypothetical protein